MEDTLKRLLTVETEAEQLVAKAQIECKQMIQKALADTHQMEQQFKAKLPQLQAIFLEKAEARATQTIAELNTRYEERKTHLRDLAEENQQKALEAAMDLVMQVGKT